MTTDNGFNSFTRKYRLKLRVSEGGTKIVQGKFGHIYEHDSEALGVVVMPNPSRRQFWAYARIALLKAGYTLVQDGGGEGAASFDPGNQQQAKSHPSCGILRLLCSTESTIVHSIPTPSVTTGTVGVGWKQHPSPA